MYVYKASYLLSGESMKKWSEFKVCSIFINNLHTQLHAHTHTYTHTHSPRASYILNYTYSHQPSILSYSMNSVIYDMYNKYNIRETLCNYD